MGNAYGCLSFRVLEVVMESSIILNMSLIRLNVSEIMWILSFLLAPKRESICVGKRHHVVVMEESEIIL